MAFHAILISVAITVTITVTITIVFAITLKKLLLRKTNILKHIKNDIKVIYHRGGAFFQYF